MTSLILAFWWASKKGAGKANSFTLYLNQGLSTNGNMSGGIYTLQNFRMNILGIHGNDAPANELFKAGKLFN